MAPQQKGITLRKRYFYGLASLAAVAALALPSAASAGTHHPAPKFPTPACQIMNPQCAEPVVAQSADPTQDLNPNVNFAMTYLGANPNTGAVGGKVFISTNNNLTGALEGTQDWTFEDFGAVPPPGTQSRPFGLTQNDLQLYGQPGDAAELASIEYTPFGQATPFCLSINRYNLAVLQLCSGKTNQVFLITDDAPFTSESPAPYVDAPLARRNASGA